jgi:hypothetical protein
MKHKRRWCRVCKRLRDVNLFYKRQYRCKECKKKDRQNNTAQKRGLITRLLGKACIVCGKDSRISHEIYWQPHPRIYSTSFEEITKNCLSGRFARVCSSCHQRAGSAHAVHPDWVWVDVIACIRSYLPLEYKICTRECELLHTNNFVSCDKIGCDRRGKAWHEFMVGYVKKDYGIQLNMFEVKE